MMKMMMIIMMANNINKKIKTISNEFIDGDILLMIRNIS